MENECNPLLEALLVIKKKSTQGMAREPWKRSGTGSPGGASQHERDPRTFVVNLWRGLFQGQLFTNDREHGRGNRL